MISVERIPSLLEEMRLISYCTMAGEQNYSSYYRKEENDFFSLPINHAMRMTDNFSLKIEILYFKAYKGSNFI